MLSSSGYDVLSQNSIRITVSRPSNSTEVKVSLELGNAMISGWVAGVITTRCDEHEPGPYECSLPLDALVTGAQLLARVPHAISERGNT